MRLRHIGQYLAAAMSLSVRPVSQQCLFKDVSKRRWRCARSLRRVSQESFKGHSSRFQRCLKGVIRKFQGLFEGTFELMLFHSSSCDVSRKFKCNSRMFQRTFYVVSMIKDKRIIGLQDRPGDLTRSVTKFALYLTKQQ